ncbi:MAG TPA: B12-binding domain-containing radical SAM protein, partial [Clostridiaceae bacterium]|nr:B12-binding domain-containing radical SAM protein [Clostridiaceae bacterium]
MNIVLAALNSKFIHTNLAIRYIRSYCKDFDMDIKEFTINDSTDSVIRGIYSLKPDILGFSCYIWNIEMVLKVCSSLKKIKPKLKILLGGPEVSFDAVDLMRNHPYIDYIIRGEGELSSHQFFDYIVKSKGTVKDIGNLTYRDKGQIIENAMNPLIENLAIIPFPYKGKNEDFKNKILYYESSRGCPYRCKYCLSSTTEGVRFMPLYRAEQDLLWFIENNISLVKFVDRTFNCGRYYKEIIKFLIQHCKNTRFHFEISGEALDEEAINLLQSAPYGLFQLEIGVQTTNKETLLNIDRHSDFNMLSRKISMLRKNDNMEIHLDLIAGLPGEDYISFARSFNDVYKLKPHMLQLGFLKVLKGSKMREEAGKYGIIYTDYTPYEVISTDWISFDEIANLKRIENVVDIYYNSGRFQASIKYMMPHFKTPFSMFEKISDYMSRADDTAQNLGNVQRYRILYEFSKGLGMLDMKLKECMMFDYLSQGRNPSVPDFLKNGLHIDKNKIWGFIRNADNMAKYFSDYSDKSVKEITKNINAAKFSFDIPSFLDEGRFQNVCSVVIFDYGTRNYRGAVRYFT